MTFVCVCVCATVCVCVCVCLCVCVCVQVAELKATVEYPQLPNAANMPIFEWFWQVYLPICTYMYEYIHVLEMDNIFRNVLKFFFAL